MDMEFRKFKSELLMIKIDTTAANKHVSGVEQQIRIVKEWCRGILATLLFTFLPNQITVNLVLFVTMWPYALPNNSGISMKWSPQE